MSLPPLTLALEFARAEQPEDPWAFRFVPQDYLLRTAGGGFERAHLAWDESLLGDLEALRRPGSDPVVLQRVGERLRQFVASLGWPELAAQLRAATEQGRGVLLTVRSAAAELYALPWELLTLKASGQHVGELAGVLLRYEWPETTTVAEQPLPRPGGGRIVVASSAAGGAVPAAEHVRAVSAACQAGGLPFDPTRDVLAGVSLGRLSAALAAAKREGRPIAVLHILCHGGLLGSNYGLLLDGEDGQPGAVDAGRLRQLLGQHADMVRLVVLMACDSGNPGRPGNQLGSLAQALHRAGIAAVVASRYPLSVAGSVRLATSLYAGLLSGLSSLETALLAARSELATAADQWDWASLQLYARAADGVDSRPLVFRPYPGLAAFASEQSRFYFGREALTDRLWNRCQELLATPGATRLLAVLGPSGSGKSSVARAGLLAEIARRPLAFAGRRPGGATAMAILKPGEHPRAALADALATLPPLDAGASRLVLIDQFEEVYTLCTDAAERSTFVAQLLALATTADQPVLVVLTLRSDFIGETQRQHPDLNRLFDEQAKIVTAMSSEELRRSITQPAVQLGRPIDEATLELLLSEAQGRDGALPLLEFALSLIWEGMLAGRTPAATLHDIGGVGGALAGKARAIYGALTPAEQATAQRALVRLVRLGEGTRDTRRRAPVGELGGRADSEAAVLSVLRRFASESARLLTLSGDGAATVAEVTHEALFDHWVELRTWINQSRKDRGLHDRTLEAAKLWEADGRPGGRLWRSPDLELLREYQQRKPEELSPLQAAFLAAGIRQQREEKWLRVGAIAAVGAALFLAAGVYLAKERQRRAEVEQKLADSYVDHGQQLLFEDRNTTQALLWLHRAQKRNSKNAALPELLHTALQSLDANQAVLLGHQKDVNTAEFSPDGRRIVTASNDGTARLWEAQDGRLAAELKGHTNRVLSATFSPDGRRILTSSTDKMARLWDAQDGRLVAELKGHADVLWGASFSPDGRRIVTTSSDQTARVWDAAGGQLLVQLKGHEGVVRCASFSADGRRIVTGGDDNTARVWETDSGRQLATLAATWEIIGSAAFSPDGRRIVLTTDHPVVNNHSFTVEVWEAEGGRLFQLTGHTNVVNSAVFSPDGQRIVTASLDHTARLWDAKSGQQVAELKGHASYVSSAKFSPDGQYVVTASQDQAARVWTAADGQLLVEFKSHGGPVNSAAFSPDGRFVVTASRDATARVWDMSGSRPVAEITGPGKSLNGATYSPDGRLIAAAGKDGITRVFEVAGGRLVAELKGHSQVVNSATFSPDGRLLVTASSDATVRVWEVAGGRLLTELKGHKEAFLSANFSPDSRRIVTGSTDATAQVWEAAGGRLLTTLKGHGHFVNSARFSPDGQHIVTASEDLEAWVWNAAGGPPLAMLRGHEAAVRSAVFAPDGQHLVTASDDQTARVWAWQRDKKESSQVAVLTGHADGVTTAAYSPDGQRIVTASSDHTVRVWDARSGRPVAELWGRAVGDLSASYSPDGRRILTMGSDHVARLWDLSETRSAERVDQLLDCHVAAAFADPDSNFIVSAIPHPELCQSGARPGR